MSRLAAVVVAAVAAFSGYPDCAAPPSPPAANAALRGDWTVVTPAAMTSAQKTLQQKCTAAVQAMAERLMRELTTAIDTGGPVAAIDVCRSRAPEIAAAVSEEYGVAIGRTSFRLRNPSNRAPAWASELVAERVVSPIWLAGPDGRVGGLLPIRLKAGCEVCHGPKEQIAPEVLSALAASYPDDAATGFKEGDLRGWFWVEAPPRR